jgi:hypothetical protein
MTSRNELSRTRSDGSAFAIHPLWLREQCQDAARINRSTRRRLYAPSDLDLEPALVAVSAPAIRPAAGLRYLQRCYLDIDGPRNLYRMLRKRRAA